jgi:hypothetical protein
MTTKNLVPRSDGEGKIGVKGSTNLTWKEINAVTGSFDDLVNTAGNDLITAGDNITITKTSSGGSQYTITSQSSPITGTLEDLSQLPEVDAADKFIVSNSQGVFGYESPSDVRSTLSLSNTDSVTFGDITSSTVVISNSPTSDNHAATKSYVDSVAAGLSIYDPVKAATTASFVMASVASNTTLVLSSGEGGFDSSSDVYEVDGIDLSEGDRVLVKDGVNSNSTGVSNKWNGIYIVGNKSGNTLTLTRSSDMDVPDEFDSGAFFFVQEGTNNADAGFVLSTDDTVTVGTTDIEFVQFSGAGQVSAGAALLKSGNLLSVDINGQTAEATIEDVDEILIYDNSASSIKKMTRANFVSGLGAGSLSNIVEDTTPALGGDLDVNGSLITSIANGDIEVSPNGTGSFKVQGNSTSGSGLIVLNCEQNSHGIKLQGPPHSASADYTLTFPDTAGSTNQVLKTDGSGNLDWADQSGGSALTVNRLLRTDAIMSTYDSSIYYYDVDGNYFAKGFLAESNNVYYFSGVDSQSGTIEGQTLRMYLPQTASDGDTIVFTTYNSSSDVNDFTQLGIYAYISPTTVASYTQGNRSGYAVPDAHANNPEGSGAQHPAPLTLITIGTYNEITLYYDGTHEEWIMPDSDMFNPDPYYWNPSPGSSNSLNLRNFTGKFGKRLIIDESPVTQAIYLELHRYYLTGYSGTISLGETQRILTAPGKNVTIEGYIKDPTDPSNILSTLTVNRHNGIIDLVSSKTTSGSKCLEVKGVTTAPSLAVNDLSDVNVSLSSAARDNAILSYDNTNSEWIDSQSLTLTGNIEGSIITSSSEEFRLNDANKRLYHSSFPANFGDDLSGLQSTILESNQLISFKSDASIFSIIPLANDTSNTYNSTLRFYDGGDGQNSGQDRNYISMSTPGKLSSSVKYSLPIDSGSYGQVLTTDGNANLTALSWTTVSGGSSSSLPSLTTVSAATGTLAVPASGELEKIYIFNSANALTWTVPNIANNSIAAGFKYNVKNIGSGQLTINAEQLGSSGGTDDIIDGQASITLSQYDSYTIVSVGDSSGSFGKDWYII